MSSFNWNQIRTLEGSQQEGFEEFVCQLAKLETITNKVKFIRKGKPDAGVECFWVRDDESEWAWQAKFFTNGMGDTQWTQIDKSVKTALDKHPQLSRYYIAIPYDPPDARLQKKKSTLQKWNDRVIGWTKLAKNKGMTVEFVAWWSSDMISRIQKPSNEGLAYFWFNQDEFTDQWFKQNNNRAIKDLGRRYIPNIYEGLSLELPILQEFDGVSRNANFERLLNSEFDELLKIGYKAIPSESGFEKLSGELSQNLDKLKRTVLAVEFSGIDEIPIGDIREVLEKLLAKALEIEGFYYSNNQKDSNSRTPPSYGYQTHNIHKFIDVVESTSEFLRSEGTELLNRPFLLLTGEAGSGKSFLFADVVSRRLNENKFSLFLLGQHFVTNEDPWTQIKKKLDVSCSFEALLGSLSSKAQLSGHRLIIFIDALNEGEGKKIWRNNLISFIDQIRNYPWLGVAMSIRTTYEELIWPENYDQFVKLNHYGFEGHEFDAIKLFFSSFNIDEPTIPVLNPEFSNPLFLLLFCEGLNKSGLNKIPDGMHGITAVFDLFIKTTNQTLSLPENLDFDSSLNFVEAVIDSLLEAIHQKGIKYLPYIDAHRIFVQVCNDLGVHAKRLDTLVSEGIFAKNVFWNSSRDKYEEGLYFAYERFADHRYANYLIQQNESPELAFSESGNIYQLLSTRSAMYQYSGLIEALSIQLPEKIGKELYELINPDLQSSFSVVEAFIESLRWRRFETMNSRLLEYVNKIINSSSVSLHFGEVLLSVSPIPEHFFNAERLHKTLFKMEMADRDAWWATWLKQLFQDGTGIHRFIDWAWLSTPKSNIQKESKLLAAITLAWFLSSPIRGLRDKSTKALINLLINDLDTVVDLLIKFEGINDPYVYERLLAVAYGCVLRSNDYENMAKVSDYVYKTFFDVEGEVYPHVLLRDYARGIIEYSHFIGAVDLSDSELDKARPPYKSNFFPKPLTNNELDEKYELDNSQTHSLSQNRILNSMTTEYGRGICGYGDFGRYTFESQLRNWDVNADEMSNVAVEWIFEKYGYNAEKHGAYDQDSPSGRGSRANGEERIGKKYQWISLHELLARISDNCSMYSEKGWDEDVIESYEGAWQPGTRDIDPSMYLKEFNNKHLDYYWWEPKVPFDWGQNTESWVLNQDELPNLDSLFEANDEDESWLVLESYPTFSEPIELGKDKWEDGHKKVWFQVRSYLVSEDSYESVISYLNKQKFMGRWMPESSSLYNVFDGEYYWSPAFKYHECDYYGGSDSCDLKDRKKGGDSYSANLTTSKYLYERGRDNSYEDASFSFLKPSKFVFEGMKLVQTADLGSFIDESEEVVCSCPSVEFDTEEFFLAKKGPFLNFLAKNKLKIIWTVLGEKQFIAKGSEGFQGVTEISGVYYLNDENAVDGDYQVEVFKLGDRR